MAVNTVSSRVAKTALTGVGLNRQPRRLGRRMLRNPLALTGSLLLAVVVAAALVAPLIAQHSPLTVDPANRLAAPGSEHWFGTDEFGRDLFARVLFGARLSLGVGGAVALAVTVLGGSIGLLAGISRQWDGTLMRCMDGLMAFPGVLLATAIMAALGPRIGNVILALAVVCTPRMARVVRAQVLVVRESLYVEAAVALGASRARILTKHLLPNVLSPAVVQASVIFAFAVLTEAALSFLGVGAPPEAPSWGNILSEGRMFMAQAPWLTLYPGGALMITVLGLNLLGDGLRDSLDPKR